MTTFVDTSAFFALLDDTDERFEDAARWLDASVVVSGELLVTHNYVVVESTALVQRRLGAVATRAFLERLLPVSEVRYVDQALHDRATVAFLASLGRRPSFVDQVSFEFMRAERIDRAFGFDRDFAREGFDTVP